MHSNYGSHFGFGLTVLESLKYRTQYINLKYLNDKIITQHVLIAYKANAFERYMNTEHFE